jgi:exosortase
VVLALFWWKRNQLLALPPRAWTPALVLLAVALSLHVVAYLIQQPLASTVALFVGIFALIGVAWGPGWMKASIFPFGLFVFSLPTSTFAQPITFQLRLLVAKLVSAISSGILGLNVIREGTQLFNSTHTYGYEVAAACSGLRSSIAIFALSTIYGFITFEKNWKRVVMMAAAFPLAIIGNTIRMMTIVVAAELYGQKGGDFVHENTFFSMVPYVPAIIGVIALAHWLREKTPEAPLALNPKPA